MSYGIENILIDIYPINDGDCDHYDNGKDCDCNPVIAWVDFIPLRYHERINTEQKIIDGKRPDKIPIDWN